jgi:hypothetical protein
VCTGGMSLGLAAVMIPFMACRKDGTIFPVVIHANRIMQSGFLINFKISYHLIN